jgi:hypothetical protein
MMAMLARRQPAVVRDTYARQHPAPERRHYSSAFISQKSSR